MRYFRCKCGESTAWSSMGTYPCDKCSRCGSSLAESPASHREPMDHEFVDYPVESDQGNATLARCKFCGRTKKQLKLGFVQSGINQANGPQPRLEYEMGPTVRRGLNK